MKFTPNHLLLYAITDHTQAGRQTLCGQIAAALRGGATMIQLREKNLSHTEFAAEAYAVKTICQCYHVPLIINDAVDVALEVGADGVHVGSMDMPVAEIRKKAGKSFIIGATAKTVSQARACAEAGADYLGVGAIFPSPAKPDAVRITPADLRAITAAVSIPCVAIGGITVENAAVLAGCGAAGIAAISAIFGAPDITEACSDLKQAALAIRDGSPQEVQP